MKPAAFLISVVVVAAVSALTGCAPAVETDQARLCRMALPALLPEDVAIRVVDQSADKDAQGLVVAYSARESDAPSHDGSIACRFRLPGRPTTSRDLVGVTLDGEPITDAALFFLQRYWLATPEGRGADPAPLGDERGAISMPRPVAYGLQLALDGLPRAAVYALMATAYSLIYGLIGRVNFAFGEFAAAGGYAAALAAIALAGLGPLPLLGAAFVLAAIVAGGWGFGAAQLVFLPLRRANGQQALVATVGLALALSEFLRLAQGDRSSWMSPLFNQPFAVGRAGDFVVAATPMAFVSSGAALFAGLCLVAFFRWSNVGRTWRAYADDPFAAELLGVSPAAITSGALILAGALTGLAGAIMTAAYGAVGYGLAPTLTLKALAAAVLGGVGSLPGAFVGGLLIGAFETGWSALFIIDYRDAAVYALLATLIGLRPEGLFGARGLAAAKSFGRGP